MIKPIWLWLTHVHEYKDYETRGYIENCGIYGYKKITRGLWCEECNKFKKHTVKIKNY
jgi:hypothetical protein